MDGCDEIRQIREQIEYDTLAETYPTSKLDCIVSVFRDVLFRNKKSFLIDGEQIPAAVVKEKFRSLTFSHVEYVFDALAKSKTIVKRWPNYLLTALFHAPETMDLYYEAWVRHDMEGGAAYAAG